MKKLLVITILLFLSKCASDKIAGTTDETDTSIVGKVTFSNGVNAGNVKVTVFQDTATIPLLQTKTAPDGNYKFSKLDPGTYNIWAESNDSIVAYADKIDVPLETKITADLTLVKGGTVTSYVKLQPGHNPASVLVHAQGTQKYTNVSNDGQFTLNGLAPGEYTIVLTSSIQGYTPTYRDITIESDIRDTLKTYKNLDDGTVIKINDSIPMVFSGLPIVTGVKATYDPFTGVAKISWDKTACASFYQYRIFRDDIFAIDPSKTPYKVSPDSTVIYDTLFRVKTNDSSVIQSSTVAYRYRVIVRNMLMEDGKPYEFADVTAIDPRSVVNILEPQDLTLFSGNNDITVRWSKMAAASKYRIQLASTKLFTMPIKDTLTSDTTLFFKNLSAGSYYLRICGVNTVKVNGFWNQYTRFNIDLFSITFAAPGNETPRQLIKTSDGGFFIIGESSINTFDNDIKLNAIKTDSAGMQIWNMQDPSFRPVSADQTDDRGYLISGVSLTHNTLSILKLNETGEIQWRYIRPDSGFVDECPIIKTSQNGCIIPRMIMLQGKRTYNNDSLQSGDTIIVQDNFQLKLLKINAQGKVEDSIIVKEDTAPFQEYLLKTGTLGFSLLVQSSDSLVLHEYDFGFKSHKTMIIKGIPQGTISFVRGNSDGSFFIFMNPILYRISKTGSIVSQIQINSMRIGSNSIAVNSNNEIFISGLSDAGSNDLIVQKHSSNGALEWTSGNIGSVSSHSNYNFNPSIILEADGFIDICATTETTLNSDINLFRLTPDGKGDGLFSKQ